MSATPRRNGLRKVVGAGALLLLAGGIGACEGTADRVPESPPARPGPSAEARAEPDPAPSVEPSLPATRAEPEAPPEAVPALQFVFPASVVRSVSNGGPGAGDPSEVWLVEEDARDPSGRVVTGPHEGVLDPDGSVSVPRRGNVLRWWLRNGQQWSRGHAADEASGGRADDASVQRVAWGQHGLVRLRDDRGLDVEGVDVTLQRTHSAYRQEVSRARTDADGLVLLQLPGQGSWKGRPAPPPDEATAFRVEIPVLPPVTAPFFRGGPWPTEIRLPPLGEVEVTVSSGDGPVPPCCITLVPLVGVTQPTGSPLQPAATLVGGRARFRNLGSGVRFAAVCTPTPDRVSTRGVLPSRVSTRVEFDSPPGPGAPTVVEVPLGAFRPCITGRLIGSTGAPVPRRQVTVGVARPPAVSTGRGWTYENAFTDERGSFEAWLDTDLSEVDSIELTVQPSEGELALRRMGSVAPGATFDLGDLRLTVPPAHPTSSTELLVSGRVVDEAGAPVTGVSVSVARRRGEAVHPVRDPPVPVAADGTFEIRRAPGAAVEWLAWLTMDPECRRAESVRFAPGAKGVTLVLRPTEKLDVRVLLPEGLPDGQWPWIDVRGDVVDATRRRVFPADGGVTRGSLFDGTVTFTGLRPGTGRVVAYPPGHPDRVLAAMDVTVGTGTPAEVGTLDLRTAVPIRTVRVVGVDGRPAGDATVWWRISEAARWNAWNPVMCWPDGTARVPGMTPVDLLVHRLGDGFGSAALVRSDVTLRIPKARRPTPVEVVLADGVEVPSAPFWVEVALFRDNAGTGRDLLSGFTDPRNPPSCRPEPTASSGRARVEVAEPGRYRVHASLCIHWMSLGGSGRPLPLEGEPSVEIGDDGAPRTIAVRYTREAFSAAMASLLED